MSVCDNAHVAEDVFPQFHLAQAASEVDAAYDRVLHNFEEMISLARDGKEIPLSARVRYRWDVTKAIDRSMHAVDRLFTASSGRAVFLNNPLQRAWRDIHAMRAHAGNNLEKGAAVFGRSECGLPPQDFRF